MPLRRFVSYAAISALARLAWLTSRTLLTESTGDFDVASSALASFCACSASPAIAPAVVLYRLTRRSVATCASCEVTASSERRAGARSTGAFARASAAAGRRGRAACEVTCRAKDA